MRLRHVDPRRTVVLRHLHRAVVGADPDDTRRQRRLGDGRDGAELDVAAAERLAVVVGREVGADLLPRVAAVERSEQHLRAGVEDLRVVRREHQGRVPVPPQRRLVLRPARHDVGHGAQHLVDAPVIAELRGVVEPARVGRVDAVVHPVAGADGDPVGHVHLAGPAVARALPGVVVLHPAVDVVRVGHVGVDGVELADGDVHVVVGRLAPVVGDVEAAVAADQDPVRVLLVPPDHAEVAERLHEHALGRPRRALPRLAAVARVRHRVRHDHHVVRVARIDAQDVERVRRLAADAEPSRRGSSSTSARRRPCGTPGCRRRTRSASAAPASRFASWSVGGRGFAFSMIA